MSEKGIKRVVYTSMTVDLFHYGHLRALKFAHNLGDYHICGVFTDEVVQSFRRRPIANLEERKAVIENLKCVDRVVVQDKRDSTEILKRIHKEFPNSQLIFVRGADWNYFPEAEYLRTINGEIEIFPYYKGLSDFKIITGLLEGYKGKSKDFKEFTDYFKINGSLKKNIGEEIRPIVSTKANTLMVLQPLLKSSRIEKLLSFTLLDWKENKSQILPKIKETFNKEKVTIGNSQVNENSLKSSMASYFYNESNIPSNDKSLVESAIEKIIGFYKEKGFYSLLDPILVQSQTKDIELSGVVFTSLPEEKDQCYIINYDDKIKNLENQTISISRDQEHPKFKKLVTAIKEIESIIPNIALDIEFAINKNEEIIIQQVRPLTRSFIHAWGGTTSIQSLECHTLRYIKFPQIGDTITRTLFCEIRNRHHTVYFEERDILRWNQEGTKLLNKQTQNKIINENLDQIKRFHAFVENHKNEDYSKKTNRELLEIYTTLLDLVMENGSFFAYSREDTIKPIKEKIFSLLRNKENKQDIFQLLITPVEEDIFLKEKKDKLSLVKRSNLAEKDMVKYMRNHPWLFINTYSEKMILDFISSELSQTNPNKLEKEIQDKIQENELLKEKQNKEFKEINSPLIKDLCLFLQKISVIRLENKNIWAGYESLFLGLFKEIAKRIGLDIEDYMYSYRIEETKNFLKEGKIIPQEIIEKRQKYFNLNISPTYVELDYTPKYSNELTTIPPDSESLKGEPGSLGKVIGRALVVTDDSIKSIMKLKEEMTPDDIYITTMTHPAMVSILHDVKGIITDEGGITSHAAIISRELNIPSLVGTRVATRFFKTGDVIEIDSYNNYVRKLSKKETEEFLARKIHKHIKKKEGAGGIEMMTIQSPAILPYTINFEDVKEKEMNYIGGKGLNLVRCLSHHKVPKGFCITNRLYNEILEKFFKENKEFTINIKNIDEFQENLIRLRKFIQDYEFDDKLKNEIIQKFRNLDSQHVAVRSSASCEDSTKNSFAGQFKTILGVREEKLIDAIKECIASSFTGNVILYMSKAGTDFENFYMAIIIQRFLESEKAGVLFSKNPSDPLKEGFWIDANFGVGESVVSGRVKPDRYFIGKNGIEASISDEKEVHSYLDGRLSITKKSDQVLNDYEIEELLQLGKSLKDFFNQDIESEWCFFNNELHLLQVRPITV